MESAHNSKINTYAYLTGIHKNWYGLTSIYSNYCDNIYESFYTDEKKPFDDYVTLKKLKSSFFNGRNLTYVHLLSCHHIGEIKQENKIFQPEGRGWTTNNYESRINHYDNGVYQIDNIIKDLYLWKSNELENGETLIILTADHGESLGENGIWGHSGDLTIEKISIPMIFIGKNLDKIAERSFSTILDLTPTIAKLWGIKSSTCWQGTSLTSVQNNRRIKLNSGNTCSRPFGSIEYISDTIRIEIDDSKNNRKEYFYKNIREKPWKSE